MTNAGTVRGAISDDFAAATRLLEAFQADPDNLARIERAAQCLARTFRAGGKVMACGNGGSCCDAVHFCEEFTGRFRHNRRPLPAIACADPGHVTCTANDFGYDEVFSRWVEALGRPEDCLVVLSTSGNSSNVVRAVEAARERGMGTLALLGKGGGQLKGRCDFEWIVPGLADARTGRPLDIFADRIQEIHMLTLHVLINAVERLLVAPEASIAEVKNGVGAAL